MIEFEVRCRSCHRVLEEPPDLPAHQRLPCPACSSVGRERSVVMIPGEPAAAPGSAEAAWLALGSALARAAQALELSLKEDELTPAERKHAEKDWLNVLKALDEYREANRGLRKDV